MKGKCIRPAGTLGESFVLGQLLPEDQNISLVNP